MRRFVQAYGANPLHLLALLASFAVAAYAVVELIATDRVWVVLWFVGPRWGTTWCCCRWMRSWTRRRCDRGHGAGAIVDTAPVRSWRLGCASDVALPAVPWINYLRAPVLLSGTLLLVYFPSILQLSDEYPRYSALSSGNYLETWLLVTAALFVLSAVAYAVRLRRARAGSS